MSMSLRANSMLRIAESSASFTVKFPEAVDVQSFCLECVM